MEVTVSMTQLKKSLTFLQMVHMNQTLKTTQLQSRKTMLIFQATGSCACTVLSLYQFILIFSSTSRLHAHLYVDA